MQILLKKLYCLLLSFLLAGALSGQEQKFSILHSLALEVSANHGFFMAEKSKTQYLRDAHTNFLELALSVQSSGQKDWQIANRFPKMGLGFMFGSPGSERYLGKMAALYPFVNFPLYRKKNFYTGFRLGLGVGWVEKIFDKQNNHKNLVIGTHLNACINTMLQAEWAPLRSMAVAGGLAFTHLSNGSIKIPNLGLNIPTAFLGVKYYINRQSATINRKLASVSKKWEKRFFAYAAGKQAYPIESAVYLVPTVSFEMMKPLSAVSKIGGGVNFTYDRSLKKEIPDIPEYKFDRTKLQLQASVFGSYEHILGKLSIPLQVGLYCYNNYKVNATYQNIGVRYRFTDRMTAALQLKTHLGKADYIQWGLGYAL